MVDVDNYGKFCKCLKKNTVRLCAEKILQKQQKIFGK